MAVIVVSGLPRSGTSMMMRALESGGIAALTDKQRVADRDNPNGYYELEVVKKTRDDSSWLEEAGGKTVKLIYQLIYDLPVTHRYKVIVMQRRIDEILMSQEKMLARLGHDKGPPDEIMKKLFLKEIDEFRNWSQTQSHLELIEVQYRDVIESPGDEFTRIERFLGLNLDIAGMCSTIDPRLHRNRQ